MRVKEYDDGTLVLKGDILEGAKEAYQKDRIVEAFALLHAFIEWEMANLYERSYSQSKGHLSEIYKEMQKYRFPQLKRILHKSKIIKSREKIKLEKWYNLRNKIIHRLVSYSFHPYCWNKVTREEVEQGFLEGKALAKILRERVFELARAS